MAAHPTLILPTAYSSSSYLVTMEAQAPFAATALQPQFPQGRILNILDDDFNDLLQCGFRQGQVFDIFEGDPKDPMHHQFQQGQVFDIFDRDPKYPTHLEIPQGQVYEMSDENFNGVSTFPEHIPWEATGLAYRSRDPSVVASTGPLKYPSIADWEKIRPVFTKLYSTENRPLKDVKRMLEREHSFVATYSPWHQSVLVHVTNLLNSERMYKARINSWKLCKNLKKTEKAAIVRTVRQKRLGGRILHNGRPINHRLVRYCKENSVSLGNLESPTHETQSPSGDRPVDFNSRAESAPRNLQSLFRAPFQPFTLIALHGGMRTAEEIIRNTHVYLDFYFSTGPGTRYYHKVDPTAMTVHRELPAQQFFILIRNEEAWNDAVDPIKMYSHIVDAFEILEKGFIDSAFTEIGKAFELVRTILEQQTPTLLSLLFRSLTYPADDSSGFARTKSQFILDMAVTVLGDAHPFTKIVHQLCKFSVAAEKSHVWRAVTDLLSSSFEVLEDSTSLHDVRYSYSAGVRDLGFLNEAENCFDVVYSTKDGVFEEQNPVYIYNKAYLKFRRKKYLEAEIQYRKCLELLKEAEREILAGGSTDSEWPSRWSNLINNCLFRLARILEHMNRIDEVEAMFGRALEFCSAAFGPDSARFQVGASRFDDFLTCYGYIEESAALKAQYPCLLARKRIPKEFL